MIEPSYLAHLRKQYRAELVITLVQLEQLCPGWWQDMYALAEQLGTDRSTLNNALCELEKRDLIKRHSISGRNANLWLWWVKTDYEDKPKRGSEPAWNIVSMKTGATARISLTRRHEWAKQNQISFDRLRYFLFGHASTLKGEWRIVSTPFDR